MCNPALHPLWSVIGRPAGLRKPGPVWMIVSCLMQDDPILRMLNDKGRVAVLAEWSGLKPLQVALVLAGLQHYGVMVEGRIVLGDDVSVLRPVLRSSDGLKTDAAAERRIRRVGINRRYYLKRKGLQAAAGAPSAAEFKTEAGLNQTPPSLEEREQEHLFPSGAREQPLRPAVGWGVQAEVDKQARAARWLSNVMQYAQPRMSQSDWAKLWEAGMREPRPLWAQAQLDEWSRRMKADKERAPPPRPDPRQPEMLMPIGGPSTSKTALATGIRADWNERMVNYRRLVGG